MAVSKRIRFEALRRSNFACFYCGRPAPLVQLEVDHVIPRARGGCDEPWNLVAACQDCNAGKLDGVPTQETLDRARGVWCASQAGRSLSQLRCRCCGVPIDPEGPADEWQGESGVLGCSTCMDANYDAYLLGYHDGLIGASLQ